jgi:ATP synthase protein I
VNPAEIPQSIDVETTIDSPSEPENVAETEDSMDEYRQLKLQLFVGTSAIALVVFVIVAVVANLYIALNYLLGAAAGLWYLRLLSKDVDRIGSESQRISWNRMALFVGLMVVAAKWHQLQVLPVFLGFLTYKAALLAYLVKSLLSEMRSSQ